MRAGLGKTAATLAFGLFGVGVALVAAACGSSGSTPADDPDAAGDAQVALDGPIPDPDAGADALADARKDVVVVPPDARYCAKLVPAPKFCDDFDDDDLTNGWDQVAATGGGLMDLDGENFTSPPASFAVQTQNLTTQTSGNVLMRKTVFGTVNHAKLSFSAFMPSVTIAKGTVAIATLDVSLNHFFTLNLRDGDANPAASLEEYANGVMTRHVLTALPPANAWTRITIDLDFTTGKANVTFDATKALDAEPITPLAGTEATIRLGAVYFDGPAAPFRASFDDVVVDF